MMTRYCLKTFELILIIMNIAYFLSMFFMTFVRVAQLVLTGFDPLEVKFEGDEKADFFISNFELDKEYFTEPGDRFDGNVKNAIRLMYYSFTSLSTVGFGDYHPRSNAERLCVAFMLLFGVAIFSYCMGTFIDILDGFKRLEEEIDEGDELTKFFQVFKRFNGGKDINENLKNKIQLYFEYKWKTDKNQAIDDPEELALLEQLPEHVQDKIYNSYLFQ
jgi:hypothetical protein